MIVHFFVRDKFTEQFIQFVESEMKEIKNENIYYVFDNGSEYKIKERENIVFVRKRGFTEIVRLFKLMITAQGVVLHGLWDRTLVIIIGLLPLVAKKSCWVIWGGELYDSLERKRSYKGKLYYLLFGRLIKNLKVITTTIPGDYKIVKNNYRTQAVFIQNLMYPSHLARNPPLKLNTNYKINIQVGNSATSSNNHHEVFRNLICSELDRVNQVKVPLSYGNVDYRDAVIDSGTELLKEKFVPMLSFLDSETYDKHMADIDIVIFNHRRQQGMGNIIGLLSMGKKVYIRKEVTSWGYLKSLGLIVFDASAGKYEMLPLSKYDSEENIRICANEFNMDKLKNSWLRVLEILGDKKE